MQPHQRVSDLPSIEERGQARAADPTERAQRTGLEVVDPDGRRVGEITDAATFLDEHAPRVVIGLDPEVREHFGLRTSAVDVGARFLHREDDHTVRLLEPLPDVLRHEGFNL